MHDDTWDELIDKMTDKLPGMVNEFLQQFQASGFYGRSAVSNQDLRDTAQHALSAILSTVRHGTTNEELTRRATSLGRRRARQGVDLDALEDAIQLDFSIIWQNLKTEGKAQGTEAVATLIEHVNDLFSTVNSYTLHARARHSSRKKLACPVTCDWPTPGTWIGSSPPVRSMRKASTRLPRTWD